MNRYVELTDKDNKKVRRQQWRVREEREREMENGYIETGD